MPRYIPAAGAVNSVDEVAGVVTLNAVALGVQDVRDYNWALQIEAGGATDIVVDVQGPRGTFTNHTPSSDPAMVDGGIVFISFGKAEFYEEIRVTFTGSTNAKVHFTGEVRGR